MAPPLEGGGPRGDLDFGSCGEGGVKAGPLRKKDLFFKLEKNVTSKIEGEG